MPDWNQHYALREIDSSDIATVLDVNQHLLPVSGKALDYACGFAANARWLAARGFDVTAWDASDVAIDKLTHYAEQNKLNIHAEVRDLENNPPTQPGFDVIVVSFFLHRPGLRNLHVALNPGGLLFYQTFSGQQLNGRGPSNPEYRLQPGELLQTYHDMQVLYYREDNQYGDVNSGIRDQAMLVAAKI
ncbi:MAG: methyltransferase domain-containing protein [Gammaproteobacteria bacterium]|nr:MAG: methyltransferase domain-containing protein [Gammaproteobacteria bacterium]